MYFYDTGVLCSLLRLPEKISVRNYHLYGALFENLILSDLIKQFYHSEKQPNIFYYKKNNGKEIDCIIEKSSNEIIAIEIKGGETFSKDYIKNFSRIFDKNLSINIKEYLIHPNATKSKFGKIEIIDWMDINEILET